MACKRRRSHWHSLFPRLGCTTSSHGRHTSQGQRSNYWYGRHLENGIAHRHQQPHRGSCNRLRIALITSSWVGFFLGNPKRVHSTTVDHNALDGILLSTPVLRALRGVRISKRKAPNWGCDVLLLLPCSQATRNRNKKSKSRWCFNKKTRWIFPGCPVKQHRPRTRGVMDAAGRSGFRPALPLTDPCPPLQRLRHSAARCATGPRQSMSRVKVRDANRSTIASSVDSTRWRPRLPWPLIVRFASAGLRSINAETFLPKGLNVQYPICVPRSWGVVRELSVPV